MTRWPVPILRPGEAGYPLKRGMKLRHGNVNVREELHCGCFLTRGMPTYFATFRTGAGHVNTYRVTRLPVVLDVKLGGYATLAKWMHKQGMTPKNTDRTALARRLCELNVTDVDGWVHWPFEVVLLRPKTFITFTGSKQITGEPFEDEE